MGLHKLTRGPLWLSQRSSLLPQIHGRLLITPQRRDLHSMFRWYDMFQNAAHCHGTVVKEEGHKMDPNNIDALVPFESVRPKTTGNVRKIVRFLGYHRGYVQDSSRVATSIHELCQSKDSTDKSTNDRGTKIEGKAYPRCNHLHVIRLDGKESMRKFLPMSLTVSHRHQWWHLVTINVRLLSTKILLRND